MNGKRKSKNMKPGDINAEGKEIEQDGDITWDDALAVSGQPQDDEYQQITWDSYEI